MFDSKIIKPATNISYSVPERSFVTLKVYYLLGNEVSTLVNGFQEKGSHTARFESSSLRIGIYFYRMEAGKFSDVKKLIFIK